METRVIRVEGEAGSESTATRNPLVRQLERLHPPDGSFELDLSGFEVEEGWACTLCVNAVREVLVRGGTLTLHEAPPSLVDSLERSGLLLVGGVLLVRPRGNAGGAPRV